MVAGQLTPELVREGAALVKQLDSAGASPQAAFWLYSSDNQSWKLYLVDRKVGREGPRGVYRTVQKALSALRGEVVHISLFDVTVAKPDMPLVVQLSRVISTGRNIDGIRLTRNFLNGEQVEDAYIYRMRRSAS